MARESFATDYCAFDMPSTSPFDLSAYVKSVKIDYGRSELDTSACNQDGKSRIAGMYDWTATLELYHDHADNTLDEYIYGVIGVEGTFSFRHTSAIKGTGNAQYDGEGIIFDYPQSYQLDQVNMLTLTIKGSNGAKLARATA